jgi:hypothetical protein
MVSGPMLQTAARRIASMQRKVLTIFSAFCCLGVAAFVCTSVADAQQELRRIALKSGESAVLRDYSFVVNCQSIMVGTPGLDVLEGPEELSIALKDDPVIRRDRGCSTPVPGGKVVATAKEVKEPKEARLTIRLNYNTKDGPRQSSSVFLISLLP